MNQTSPEGPEDLNQAELRDVQAIAAALPPESSAAPTAPPTHPTDRLTTISVAVIAVIGVLLGGLVAAASAWWTASVNTDSNQSIELDKFKRQEVEKAYLAYITDIQEFHQRAAAVAVAFSSHGTPDYPFEFRDQVSALLNASRDVANSTHLISLVGSKQIREAVKDMKKRAGDLTETAAFALKPWYDKGKDHKQEIDKNTRDFYLAFNPLDNEIQDAIAAMRNDLGIADQRR
ncbi:hypothetical protein [Mycolicibacterium llatzerense]|uniref:hypothetical protein n=1 Tax=Mycolicibacterium llatzerense TaxID=280871 RepID=UPI0021B56387|nr:hypothetical protein [Mycolicibacterium llatzerense]MCT7369595.1 hypothetical protein [Mycolicibacterium llatzerense]